MTRIKVPRDTLLKIIHSGKINELLNVNISLYIGDNYCEKILSVPIKLSDKLNSFNLNSFNSMMDFTVTFSNKEPKFIKPFIEYEYDGMNYITCINDEKSPIDTSIFAVHENQSIQFLNNMHEGNDVLLTLTSISATKVEKYAMLSILKNKNIEMIKSEEYDDENEILQVLDNYLFKNVISKFDSECTIRFITKVWIDDHSGLWFECVELNKILNTKCMIHNVKYSKDKFIMLHTIDTVDFIENLIRSC